MFFTVTVSGIRFPFRCANVRDAVRYARFYQREGRKVEVTKAA